ncbi:hypothetical protein QYZ87_07820 [Porphyromonadaceae bacterium W3.11]|nr:hypothetical protein [Porphyromonadaceae bacterium W3.11]
MANKRNYARLYCLLREVMPELDAEEAKSTVATQVSDGRTESLRELSDDEFEEALDLLSRQIKESNADVKKARSKALHQLQKYGIDTTDWEAVNRFTRQPRIEGKDFYHLNVKELENLTKKMRAINSKKVEPIPSRTKERTDYQLIWVKPSSKRKMYVN